MLCAIADAFNATITSMNLREMGNGPIIGALRLEAGYRTIEVDIDVAAGLSFAIHQGIPVFVVGEGLLNRYGLNASRVLSRIHRPTRDSRRL